MTDTNKPDGEAIPKQASADDVLPILEGEAAYFGADPKLITTVKAWAPGKPPGGELPSPPSPEAKAPQDKS